MENDEFEIFRKETLSDKSDIEEKNNSSFFQISVKNQESSLTKPVILIIDDDINVRNALEIMLSQKYIVQLCKNGTEGAELVSEKANVVLLDIKMEGKNGFDTFTEIKNKFPFLPIIFHSAYQDIKSPFEIMNDYRPFGYLVKGDDSKQLFTLISSATEYSFQINKNESLLKQLKIQEEQYRTLVNNLNVGVFRNTGGSNGKFLQANPALAKIFGFESVQEVLEKHVSEFYVNQNERQSFVSILEKNGFCKNFELNLKKKDGTPMIASLSVTVNKDKDGNIEWMDGVLQDITEQKKSEEYLHKLNSTYQNFVPKQFLDFLGKSDITQIQLGDQTNKEMSVLFSDIRAFTSLSETMTSEENFKFINAYLKRIAPQIIKNKGFIDKYIGDAVMALFPEQANNAIDAAIQMLEELHNYNKTRKTRNYQPISIGIGINTGNLTLGIVGDKDRMEGTVISDAVNLASRMEGLTKMYGASILISEITFQMLEDPTIYDYRIVDTVKVKGKKEPVTVIEILNGNSKRIIDLKLSTKQNFEFGTALYQEKDFKEAKNCLKKVLEKDPADKAAEIYLKRSEYFEIHGITPEWEGIASIESK